ncbi:MAG: 50S ribosome-binding GTPase, partial [Syntrophales bacterium]|nr:50S ribosome-binding GTPase [Syntrophales bacterium]
MTSLADSSPLNKYADPLSLFIEIDWEDIIFPGLTYSAHELLMIAEELRLEYAVYFYKIKLPCLWVCLIGGTGTGKSTLFNGLAGSHVSPAGVERPTTTSAIAYGHISNPVEDGFPFDNMRLERLRSGESQSSSDDASRVPFFYVEHKDEDMRHLVLVDTPDVDSVERQHRGIAEALYLLSHVVIFVASQEKYADDIPSRLLCRMDSEGKPYCIVFNKADYRQTDDELVTLFRDRGLSIRRDRFFRIPFMNSSELSGETFMSAVRLCVDGIIRDCSPSALNSVRSDDLRRIREGLIEKTDRLLSSAESEEEAARSWLKELDALVGSTSDKLLEEMASRQDRRNLSALKKQLGQIFSAYDVLAKPRRYIMSIIKSPLRVLGIVGPESAGG